MQCESLERLAVLLREAFKEMGPRQAKRVALRVIQMENLNFNELLNAMRLARQNVRRCRVCQDLAEKDFCSVCSDPERDRSIIAVVARPQDVSVLESARTFYGLYHVLHVNDAKLKRGVVPNWELEPLFERLKKNFSSVREVFLAMDQDTEGEMASLYLAQAIRERFPKINLTRIGVGIPFGGEILYADSMTLKEAIARRVVCQEERETNATV